MLFDPPPIIAFCGPPRHGKSTVQGFLQEELGVQPLDDGRPLRLEGMRRFGLTWEQVSTQEGKLEICHAYGRDMEVREALGLIGKEWEAEHPLKVSNEALKLLREEGTGEPVSFGSVRRSQGLSYIRAGGIVLEVYDPRKPLSKYDFDYVDPRYVTATIRNDGTLEDLKQRAVALVRGLLENHNPKDHEWQTF